ncbi:MAG: Uma2 family endonuclease [Candidatus Rokuibacteriota bacterium]
MTPARVVLTYRDYEALPNDGRRYEIHEGKLSVTAAPRTRHQIVSINLASALHVHVTARGVGQVFHAPTAVILSDTSVVEPDIVYVATDRLGQISERGIEGPPTLAVEILSPSTAQTDRQTKMQLYARHAVPWYWIVDPDNRGVEVYRLAAGGYVLDTRASGDEPLSAELLADLVIAPSSLWA